MRLFSLKPKPTDPTGDRPSPVPEPTPIALSKAVDVSTSQPTIDDSNMELNVLPGLFDHGFKQAVAAGITEITEQFLESLDKHARGIAREYGRPEFDPQRHLHDHMEYHEYERALKSRDDSRLGEDHALARLRQAKADLDGTKRVGDRPSRPTFLLALAIGMIAVSLTPTVHDRLMPVGMDPVLSLVLSAMIGVLLASAPVYAIFHSRNSKHRWVGITVGALFAVGLFSVRVAGAAAPSELLYSAGWALLEIAGVLLAEYFSNAHRKAELEWEDDHHNEVAAVARVRSAEEEVTLWRDRIAAARVERDRVSTIVHGRNSRALRVNDIETLCVATVRDGASAGVAHNQGMILGLRRPPQPALPKLTQSKEAAL